VRERSRGEACVSAADANRNRDWRGTRRFAFPVKKPYCMLPTKVRAGSESSFAITRSGMALPVDTRFARELSQPAARPRPLFGGTCYSPGFWCARIVAATMSVE
jgi:hypothetical protein